MRDDDIKMKILEVGDLPTLPAVMNRILETVEEETSSAADLTNILEMDHAISARVLRLANSAFYGLRFRVDTIRRAVVVIGFDAVKLLALATSVFDLFSSKKQFALDPEDFWMHSFGSAKAAQLLAHQQGLESPEACFTAGLLHDLGKFVIELQLREEYIAVANEAEAKNRPLVEVEDEHFGTNHAQVGGWLATKWMFPETIIHPIEHQYRVEHYTGPYRAQVQLVAMANQLSMLAGFGNAGDPPRDRVEAWLSYSLGLSERAVSERVAELAALRDDARRLLEILAEE